jgi:hypothetical protein
VKVRPALLLPVLAGALALPAAAQEPAPVYQTAPARQFGFHADLLLRQEWNKDFLTGTSLGPDDRRRLQFRPRLEFGSGAVQIGVGGEFNTSSDDNTRPPAGQTTLGTIRDNYDSRDARLDLAFLRLTPIKGVRLEGGRFVMPVELTEMIWDKDLRPQGAALTLSTGAAGTTRFGLTGLWARGSHVFDDDETDMYVLSAELELPAGASGTFQLVGSYVEWRRADRLEPAIRRQNTRVAGELTREYKLVDVVARVRSRGQVPLQLVADLSWNTAVDDRKRGLWLAAVLGALKTSPARLEYVFAKVDRDATLAAYGADDFFWVTGWAGHKLDLGASIGKNTSLHAVGQLQRFKDSGRADERDHWVKRLRLEVRATY